MTQITDGVNIMAHQLQKYYPAIYNNIKQRQFSYMQQCVVKNLNTGLEQDLYRKNIEVQFVARIYFNGITGIKEESLFPHTLFEVHYFSGFSSSDHQVRLSH